MRIALIIYIFSIAVHSNAQNKSFQCNGDIVDIDFIGNIYCFKKNEVIKYDITQNKSFVFSFSGYGDLSNYSVSDPFRLILYFSGGNTCILLDKYLDLIDNPISFDELNIYEIGAISLSGKQGFWIWNKNQNRIEHYNTSLKMDEKSNSLHMLLNTDGSARLFSNERNIILLHSFNAFVFDKLGNYRFKIPIDNNSNVLLRGERLIYKSDDEFEEYNLVSHEVKTIKNDCINSKNRPLFYVHNYLYHLKEGQIIISNCN